jgi:hypothetical protein
MNNWSPYELAAEARKTLENDPETPREHFARLVRKGFINSHGEVTRLLGGDAEPEPEDKGGPPATNGESH